MPGTISKPRLQRFGAESGRTVAAKPAKLHYTQIVAQILSRAVIDLNDVLNAVALRLALLRWQPDSSRTDADIDRLALLIDRAAVLVRRLQEAVRTGEPNWPALGERSLAAENAACDDSRDLSPWASKKSREKPARVLVKPVDSGVNAIRDGLKRCGYRVTVTASPQQGVKMLRSRRQFENVVCDVAMLAEGGQNFAADLARTMPAVRLYLYAPSP